MITAWMVYTWPPILWQAAHTQHTQMARQFVHLGTQLIGPLDAPGPRRGQSIWGSPECAGAGSVGVAWDWFVLTDRVLALCNPVGIASNVRWVDDANQPLPRSLAILRLNEMVNALPWQAQVQTLLDMPPEIAWADQYRDPPALRSPKPRAPEPHVLRAA